MSLTLHGDGVLFVTFRTRRVHRIQKLSFPIMSCTNNSADRASIYVNIENIQKNADPDGFFAVELNAGNAGHLAIRGRHNRARLVGDDAIGITEEPHEKRREQYRKHCPERTGEPADEHSSGEHYRAVVVAVAHHEILELYCRQTRTRQNCAAGTTHTR